MERDLMHKVTQCRKKYCIYYTSDLKQLITLFSDQIVSSMPLKCVALCTM